MKPTSDKGLLEYQKEVCCKCRSQIDLVRGIFTKGCAPVDLHGMGHYENMIKEDGHCLFFQDKPMRVKTSFQWHRNFSAGGPVKVEAGAPVEWHVKNKCFYVKPNYFEPDSILRHDAVHYGCRVRPDNVEKE